MKLQESKPYERQIVVFINENEYDNLQYSDDGVDLLTKDEVKLITMSESEHFLETYSIIGGTQPYNRMMLLLSPNNPTIYSEVAESTERFAYEKLSNILHLGYILGAKEVTVEDIYDDLNSLKNKATAEGNYGGGELNISIEEEATSELFKKINFTQTSAGGRGNYEVAKKFLQKKRLAGDSFLTNLVEMRNPEMTDNTIYEVTQEIVLTTNNEKTFKLVASLKIPIGGGKFELESQNISKQIWRCKIVFKFDDKAASNSLSLSNLDIEK